MKLKCIDNSGPGLGRLTVGQVYEGEIRGALAVVDGDDVFSGIGPIEWFAHRFETPAAVESTQHPTTPPASVEIGATKDTNPKDAIGITKVPISVLPMPVVGEVGVALYEGALKYGRHNYRDAGVRASVYFDAVVLRHLGAWWEGEDIDPDSDLSHVTKAIAGLMVLRDSMIRGNWVDDRPPKCAEGWVAELNKKTAALRAKYPNPKAPHVEKKP